MSATMPRYVFDLLACRSDAECCCLFTDGGQVGATVLYRDGWLVAQHFAGNAVATAKEIALVTLDETADPEGLHADADGTIDFEEWMHRTVSSPVIAAGLLLIPDFSRLLHCLDACTGEVCWTHDILSETWASPLAADGRVYISDQEGKITIFSSRGRRRF